MRETLALNSTDSLFLPMLKHIHIVIQQAKEAKLCFLTVFSLPLPLSASSRNELGPRSEGGWKTDERLVVLCAGRDEETNNLHYSQEGVKGKRASLDELDFPGSCNPLLE